MGTLIKKSIYFSLCMTVGYAFFILIWGLVAPAPLQKNLLYKLGGKGHMYSRIREVKQTKNIDILFIGSSLAVRGFDPRVFSKHGYKTFNLGSGGQTPLQSEWLLKEYLPQLNPKVIIFEVNPYVLSRDGVEPALDLFSNHDFKPGLIRQAITINNIKVYNTLIYAFWRKILGLNKNFAEPAIKNEDTYISGGYIEREVTYFRKEKLDRELNYSLKPLPHQQKALERAIKYINDSKIKLFLVQPPVTHTGFDHYEDDYHVEDYFSKSGNYYNFNHIVELNDTLHFFDSRHLNQPGVEKFNEALIDTLLKAR